MSKIYTQTDTDITATISSVCVTAINGENTQTLKKDAEYGGTAGSTEVTIQVDKAGYYDCVYFHIPAPGTTSWPGTGNVISVDLNVTTTDATVTPYRMDACRMSAAGANLATYGTAFPLSWNFSTTGVKTSDISLNNQTGVNITDWILIKLQIYNPNHAYYTVGVTPSESITTPFSGTVDGVATLPVTASLVAAGTVSGLLTAAATLPVTAALNAAASEVIHAAATHASTATLQATGSLTLTAQASLDSLADIIANGMKDVTGTSQLDSVASLDATGSYEVHGAASLDSIVDLTAAATVTTLHQATAALQSTAGITAVGTVQGSVTAQASLDSVATLDAIGTETLVGQTSLDSVAGLQASASLVRNAAALLPATASLQATGTWLVSASTSLASSATLQALAVENLSGYALLDTAAGLVATGTTTGGATVNGSATLSSTATMYPTTVAVQLSTEAPAAANYYVSMDLSTGDAGALKPHHFGVVARATDSENGYLGYYDADLMRWVIAKMVAGDVTVLTSYSEAFTNARIRLTASGSTLTLYADGVQKAQTTDTTFAAAGYGGVYARRYLPTYAANEALQGDNFAIYTYGAVIHHAQAALPVTVSLVATPGGNIVSATCTLNVTASIVAVPRKTIPASASLATVTQLIGTGTFIQSGQALLSGTGTLTAIATREVHGSGLLDVAATLAAVPSKDISASSTLSTTVTLYGNLINAGTASATLTTTASLNAAASLTQAAQAILPSSATVTASAVNEQLAAATFTTTAALEGLGSYIHSASSGLDSAASLNALAHNYAYGAALLDVTADLIAVGGAAITATLRVTTGLIALPAGTLLGQALLHTDVWLTTIAQGMVIAEGMYVNPAVTGLVLGENALKGSVDEASSLWAGLGLEPVMNYTMVNVEPASPLNWDWLTWEER